MSVDDLSRLRRPSEEGTESSPGENKRRRKLNHVTKACDACRLRKTKCDGMSTKCGACVDKGLSCTYEKVDGRKTRQRQGNIRDKIDNLTNLLLASQTVANFAASQRPQYNTQQQPHLPSLSPPQTLPPPSACSLRSVPPDRRPLSPFDDRVICPETSHLFQTHPLRSFQSSLVSPPNQQELGVSSNPMPDLSSFQCAMPDNMHGSTSTPSDRLPNGPQSPPSTGSAAQSVLSMNDPLKRRGTGSHMQFGPTSFWSYAPDAGQDPGSSTGRDAIHNLSPDDGITTDLLPGDYVEWARHLPPDLRITKKVHDTALALFGAYYAPWCMAADMPAFLRDMEICNLVAKTPTTQPIPRRTSNYSPLLHNCALRLGVHFNRDVWPELADMMDSLISKHCASMLIEETDDPNLSTPKALALYAACLNLRNEESAQKTGYIHFGMAFACVQALGVNLNVNYIDIGHLVESGQITRQDQALRSSSYWTLFQQDLLRAICAGRPFMLRATSDIHLPLIDAAADQDPWLSPFSNVSVNGRSSLRSSVFHWSAKLACLLRQVVDIALSTNYDGLNRDLQVTDLISKLDAWQRDQPLPKPQAHPVPHLLVMHMLYHLTYIYLLRPYFRASLDIAPSAAQRCQQAANEISELLRTFDEIHGLRNAVATIMIFGMVTIRLLVLVSDSTLPMTDSAHGLDECIGYMDEIAHTWLEARQALMVIKHLKNEWLPCTTNNAVGGAENTSLASLGPMGGLGDYSDITGGTDINEILQLLSGNGGIDMSTFFPAQAF